FPSDTARIGAAIRRGNLRAACTGNIGKAFRTFPEPGQASFGGPTLGHKIVEAAIAAQAIRTPARSLPRPRARQSIPAMPALPWGRNAADYFSPYGVFSCPA